MLFANISFSPRVTALLFFLLTTCGVVFAQSGSGDLAGIITDASGAVIGGAKIIVRSQTSLGLEVRTEATNAGYYALPSLRPGAYTVRVEAAGFKLSREHGTLDEGEIPPFGILLALSDDKLGIRQ